MNKLIILVLLVVFVSMTIVVAVSILSTPKEDGDGGLIDARAQKAICAYSFGDGFPDETADFITDHFDLLDAHYGEASIPSFRRMKARNPNLIIIVYRNAMGMYPPESPHSPVNPDWNVVNMHEDWFIHDKDGNRVINKEWGWYLMDVGNIGWRQHYADWCERVLQEQSIDGIFADDVWDTLPCGTFLDSWWNPWTVPNSWIDEAVGQRWHSNMIDFISYVKQRIGNKLLIINSLNNDDYVDACDGKMEEEFVHPHWYNYTEFNDQYINWTSKVNGVKQVSGKGKYVLVDSGFSELSPNSLNVASQEMVDKMLSYSFCSYLLAINGNKTYFSFGTYWNNDGSSGYYPLLDQADALGFPIGNYYAHQSVKARDFQNGKVLVNTADATYTISLDKDYQTPNGQTVSSIVLEGRSGIILLNQ